MYRKIVMLSIFASFLAISHGEMDGNATKIEEPPQPNNSTTTALPTVSPDPTTTTAPSTTPQTGKWRVNDVNVTCILADLAIQVELVYKNTNKTGIFNVPTTALSNSSLCGHENQLLLLEWPEVGENSLAFHFLRNNNSQFYLSQIELNMTANTDARVILESNITEFSTPLTKSYRCAKEQQLTLSDASNETIGMLKISHVQLEAFHEKKDNNFSTAEDCAPSSSPDIVPIAVGCALVGLVAIVLIAYLMGRRRSQARGYLSM